MNSLPRWNRFWRERFKGWWLDTTDLWAIVTNHKCVPARIAAAEMLIDSIDAMSHEQADGLLRLVNKYMPKNPHVIVAVDQLTEHLNTHLDELDREAEDWQREKSRRNYAYQYASYSF